MATVSQVVLTPARRLELHGVGWETYERLLDCEESRRGSVRMMYDQGRLVIVAPPPAHDISGERLGQIVRLTAAGLGLNCLGLGRTTLARRDASRGKEPDNAYYIANEPRVRGQLTRKLKLDLDVDPPPDLAIEVETTHHDPGMFDVYAAISVPEVWHFDGQSLRAFVLHRGGGYQEVTVSLGLPLLPLDEIPGWLERFETEGGSATILAFLDWVRNELAPRAEPDRDRDREP
jgi:Uma2 family endonuclease